jgi:hypothetical protein
MRGDKNIHRNSAQRDKDRTSISRAAQDAADRIIANNDKQTGNPTHDLYPKNSSMPTNMLTTHPAPNG